MRKKVLKDTKTCTDLKVIMKSELPQEGKTYRGKLTYHNEDSSTFEEDEPHKRPETAPERKFKNLTGSLHGKISMTDFGVTLHVYVRHGEYKSSSALVDMFEGETEQMCDVLSDMDLKEEVAKCGK